MNKAAAAKYLGIGVRTLERHTGEGRLSAQRIRTATGPGLDYEEGELARFKATLEGGSQGAQVLAALPPSPPASPQGSPERAPEDASALAQVEPQVLAVDAQTAGEGAQVLVPLEVLAGLTNLATLAARLGEAKERVPTADKLLLDLSEAQALTGLSRGHLRAAIDSGELSAKRIGRGWKIRRLELERWLEVVC